jgi:putative metallopeptidase
MAVTYRPAPEVEAIAGPLIEAHHQHLTEHGDVRIEYLFRSEATVKGGHVVLGKARKVSGLNAFLAGWDDATDVDDEAGDEVRPFFVIEIAADQWATLTEAQRTALVDHELCHLNVEPTDESVKLTLAGHDLEEFGAVVERHGLWKPAVELFAAACQQLKLPGMDGGKLRRVR